MDLQALAAAALAARTRVLDVAGRRITVVLPTRHDMAMAHGRSSMAEPVPARAVTVQRQLLTAAVRSWDLVAGDVVAGAGSEPLPCEPDAVALVLDDSTLGDALAEAFAAAVVARNEAAEAARKNSASA